MIRSARTAILLLAFSLLALVATAYAECAWVLWAKIITRFADDRSDRQRN